MTDWPRDVSDDETIVRGICSPYHVSSDGKLKPAAFDPTPGTDEVSVMRHDWIGSDECKARSKALQNSTKDKIYRGMAALSAKQVRGTGANILDSRERFIGHADIKHGFVTVAGEPLPPEALHTMRQRTKTLAKVAAYLPDPNVAGARWNGSPLTPKEL